jgi:hypothetical protein
MNYLVQGGQVYLSFPFSKDSLTNVKYFIGAALGKKKRETLCLFAG